ncbi:MAG: hypothetical protein AB7F19_02035 [Candidatus Babeliales bacterium]
MIHRFLSWFYLKLLSFIHIQLFVSIVSLPILISWGLPVSTLAPLGNFIFGPFLTLFLGISCIIFFTELCYIPNGIFIWCLEQITQLWLYLLSHASSTWLLSFKTPSPWFFVALLLATIAIVYHKKLQSLHTSSFCFAFLLGIAYLYLVFLNVPKYAIAPIPCNNAHITIIKTPKSFSIIDPGIIGRRISAPSWIEYSLLPTLRSQYGIQTIDNIVLLAPGIVLFDAITELIRIMPIKNIYVPLWQGESPLGLTSAYKKMKDAATRHGIKIHRIGKKSQELILDNESTLSIMPLDAQCTYRTIKYSAIKIIGQLPEDTITLYSSKYIT